MNFWQTLTKPFIVLAPMEGVTDVVFREIVATKLPQPDVFFTEFTNTEGLCSNGVEKTIQRLKFTKNQLPIVAQLWGLDLKAIESSAALCEQLGFSGIDLNMGCPDRAVLKIGAGAALINNKALAKKIIASARKGAKKIPISVKTRIGYNSINTEEWISYLLNQNIDALTIHGRTAKQKSDVPANWEEIKKVVMLKDNIAPNTIIVGNGDVLDYEDALTKHKSSGVDGVMIGRGIFANPWAFDKNLNKKAHTKEEYISILRSHIILYNKTWGNTKSFDVMKKFFKMYINSFEGASEFRSKLMQCKNAKDALFLLP